MEYQDKSLIDKKIFMEFYSKILLNGPLSEKIINLNEYYKKYTGKVEAFRYENLFKNKLIKINY